MNAVNVALDEAIKCFPHAPLIGTKRFFIGVRHRCRFARRFKFYGVVRLLMRFGCVPQQPVNRRRLRAIQRNVVSRRVLEGDEECLCSLQRFFAEHVSVLKMELIGKFPNQWAATKAGANTSGRVDGSHNSSQRRGATILFVALRLIPVQPIHHRRLGAAQSKPVLYVALQRNVKLCGKLLLFFGN